MSYPNAPSQCSIPVSYPNAHSTCPNLWGLGQQRPHRLLIHSRGVLVVVYVETEEESGGRSEDVDLHVLETIDVLGSVGSKD